MDATEPAEDLPADGPSEDSTAGGASRTGSTPKRRLASMVSVRLSPAELEAVQARAAERGESVSAYLRGLALRDITVVATPFRSPVFVTSDMYVSEMVCSPIVKDGRRLPTRAT